MSASRMASIALRHAWRVIVLVVGLTVLAIGVAMIVLPGPAVVVIPVGLAILGTEFVWARQLLHHLKERAGQLVNSRRSTDAASAASERPESTT